MDGGGHVGANTVQSRVQMHFVLSTDYDFSPTDCEAAEGEPG